MLGGSVLVLGCARPLTLRLGTACYTLIIHCSGCWLLDTVDHLHVLMSCPNEPVESESALAEDVIDNEVAGLRSLFTAPRGVLPPPSLPPTKRHFSVVDAIRCGARRARGGRVTEDIQEEDAVFYPVKQFDSIKQLLNSRLGHKLLNSSF